MKRKVLTDADVRRCCLEQGATSLTVEEDVILTPAAQDFIREHGIAVCRCSTPAGMTRTPVPQRGGHAVYIEASTGRELSEKPEELTHLHGNVLVPKTHPRIEFRGRLDSLIAQMLGVQLVAAEEDGSICEALEELVNYVRKILGAEVREQPLPEMHLLGMDSSQIRYQSHHVKKTLGIDHPIPNCRMGRMCVALNRLRTQVREVELSAARAFTDENGQVERKDIIEGLNRLSSCVYLLFCRKLSGYYDRPQTIDNRGNGL